MFKNLTDLADFTGHWNGEEGNHHCVESQGSCLKWQVKQPKSRIPPDEKRGVVFGFTKASRFRLLKFIASVNWSIAMPCLFVTLTFPDEIEKFSKSAFNKWRWIFWRHVEKNLSKKVPALWRLEWQDRKSGQRQGELMPHFHLITFTQPYIDKELVNASWKKTLGVESYIRTEVKGMRDEKQAGFYLAKYAAKVDCSLVNDAYLNKVPNGRQWGIMRKNLIERHTKNRVFVPDCPLVKAAREKALEGWDRINAFGNESFTLLGPAAIMIAKIFFGEILDSEAPPADN